MADGAPELAGLPMVYMARHLPPRKKQAVISPLCETHVTRLPSWRDDQAPIVGSVTDYQATTTHYRAARSGDGVVRLMAAVGSHALNDRPEVGDNRGFADNYDVEMYHFNLHRYCWTRKFVAAGSAAIGHLISGEREHALRGLRALAETMAIVDGVVHAPCCEPGWDMHYGGASTPLVSELYATPITSSSRFDDTLPFCQYPAQAIQARGKQLVNQPAMLGSIEEGVPGAFGADLEWARMRRVARHVMSSCQEQAGDMLDDELALKRRIGRALVCWPAERDMGLAQGIVAMARVVHGIRASGNAAGLESAQAMLGVLEANGAPMRFADRMEAAGLELPQIGQSCGVTLPSHAGALVR